MRKRMASSIRKDRSLPKPNQNEPNVEPKLGIARDTPSSRAAVQRRLVVVAAGLLEALDHRRLESRVLCPVRSTATWYRMLPLGPCILHGLLPGGPQSQPHADSNMARCRGLKAA